MIRKWRNQKEIPTPKTKVGKTINSQVLLLRKHILSRLSCYFPIGGHSITQTLLKYENVHKMQTAQNSTPKHNN